MLDAHSHLGFLPLETTRAVVNKTPFRWILGGYDLRDWMRQLEIQSQFPDRVQTCFGLHPWVVSQSSPATLQNMYQQWQDHFFNQGQFVGEIGLDFSPKMPPQSYSLQEEFFRKQLVEATAHLKPVVFHVVQSYQSAFEIIDSIECQKTLIRGFVHGFSGPIEVAREFLKRNIWISIGPQVLNPKYKKLREAVLLLDVDQILIESDSPSYPDDQGYRGQEVLPQIIKQIASLKKMSDHELSLKLQANQSFMWQRGVV